MKYLVNYEIEGLVTEPSIETATEIFEKMDMSDCYEIEITHIYLLLPGKPPVECIFRGTWYYWDDPLRMEIVDKETGDIYSVGYGTDH